MKAVLKNLSPNKLPVGWWFETESATHFPMKDTTKIGIFPPEEDLKVRTSLYLCSRKKGRDIWVKCEHSNKEGIKNTYIEQTKEQAIEWLIKNGYLSIASVVNGRLEEDLEKLILYFKPTATAPRFRKRNPTRDEGAKQDGYPEGFQEGIPK